MVDPEELVEDIEPPRGITTEEARVLHESLAREARVKDKHFRQEMASLKVQSPIR